MNFQANFHRADKPNNSPEKDEDKDRDDKKKEDDPEKEAEDAGNGAFECNICLDAAKDAVISLCGHLFCWPCLHQWLETRPNRQICPVCKAGISRDKVIPLYGRGGEGKDPREKSIPPRPQGQRPEPETTGGGGFGAFFSPFGGFGLGSNGGGGGAGGGRFQMSFGIGAFPFTFLAANFNSDAGFGRHPGSAPPGSAQYEEEQFLSKAFLWVAFAFIFWLMIA